MCRALDVLGTNGRAAFRSLPLRAASDGTQPSAYLSMLENHLFWSPTYYHFYVPSFEGCRFRGCTQTSLGKRKKRGGGFGPV